MAVNMASNPIPGIYQILTITQDYAQQKITSRLFQRTGQATLH